MKSWMLLVIASVIILLNFDCSKHSKHKHDSDIVYAQEELGVCGVKGGENPMDEIPRVFKAKCATCHSLDKDATGPKLEGVAKHLPSGEKYLRLFIRREDSLMKAKNAYALKISKSRPVNYMHNNSEITSDQLDELMVYLNK